VFLHTLGGKNERASLTLASTFISHLYLVCFECAQVIRHFLFSRLISTPIKNSKKGENSDWNGIVLLSKKRRNSSLGAQLYMYTSTNKALIKLINISLCIDCYNDETSSDK